MGFEPSAAWSAVTTSPVLGVVLTLAAYELSRRLWERLGRHPLANPVLVSIVLIGTVLAVIDVDYDTYLEGGSIIALLLGPATVALALPLHREVALVRQAVLPILGSVVVGSVVGIATAYVLVDALGGGEELALTMAPRSATTPVSIALSQTIGGIPALTAVLTILSGIIGAVAGPKLLSLMRVHDPRVRGLAVGTSSHGIGTAQMLHESQRAGAFSGLAMALTALAVAVLLPLMLPLLERLPL